MCYITQVKIISTRHGRRVATTGPTDADCAVREYKEDLQINATNSVDEIGQT